MGKESRTNSNLTHTRMTISFLKKRKEKKDNHDDGKLKDRAVI